MVLGFGGLPTSLYLSLPDSDDTAKSFQDLTILLRQQRDSLARVLRRTEVVPTVFWRQFKHLRELQLAEQYELAQLELVAYFQPGSLRTTRYYPSCARYADALASTDTAVVLRGWRQLIAEEKVHNADPDQFDREYASVATALNGVRYAKMKLLVFGWHNCTIKRSKYNDLEKYQPERRFEKLFHRVRQSNCADTD